MEAFQLRNDGSLPAILTLSLIRQVCFDQCLMLRVAAVRTTPAAFGVTSTVLTLCGHSLVEVVFLASNVYIHSSIVGSCSMLLVARMCCKLLFDAEMASRAGVRRLSFIALHPKQSFILLALHNLRTLRQVLSLVTALQVSAIATIQ